MSGRGLRLLGVRLLATAGASLLALTSMMNSAFAFGQDTALILTPSGFPIPTQSYVDAANALYIQPLFPGATPLALATPEGLYPITGVNTLPLDPSVAQGVAILDDAIHQQLAAGNHVAVFGYSQSSVIASMEMAQLHAAGVPSSAVSFVLVGNPSNPNGGLTERFNGLSIPSFGATFSGATPDNLYPTNIYTNEYDGFADFPQYPINFLSVFNALLGIGYQHSTYVNLTPQQISSAIPLPTVGDTLTHYYMIPAASMPLLDPVRLLPIIGNPLADLLQPDMTVLVNLGYGNINHGWSPGPANVPTPFGLFPTNINFAGVLTALVNGVPQGIANALKDLQHPTLFDTSSLSGLLAAAHTFGLTPSDNPSLLELVEALSTFGHGDVPVTSTGPVDALTQVVSTNLGLLRPFADTALALGVTFPQYNANLFTDQLQAGNLLNAIGFPIAADTALVPFAIGFGALGPVAVAAAITVTLLAGAAQAPTTARIANNSGPAVMSILQTPSAASPGTATQNLASPAAASTSAATNPPQPGNAAAPLASTYNSPLLSAPPTTASQPVAVTSIQPSETAQHQKTGTVGIFALQNSSSPSTATGGQPGTSGSPSLFAQPQSGISSIPSSPQSAIGSTVSTSTTSNASSTATSASGAPGASASASTSAGSPH